MVSLLRSVCADLAARVRAHRGNAAADLDGDGSVDVVVSAFLEPAEVMAQYDRWQQSLDGN